MPSALTIWLPTIISASLSMDLTVLAGSRLGGNFRPKRVILTLKLDNIGVSLPIAALGLRKSDAVFRCATSDSALKSSERKWPFQQERTPSERREGVKIAGDDRRRRLHPHRATRRPLHLRHPQHRRRGEEGRGGRHARVRYLNIGDPNQFGFLTPPHLIEAVAAAMRDGHNGYTASAGIVEAREAVAADFAARGVSVSPDRVLITSGTSEGIELALTAIVDEGEDVLVPSPTYPLYTAVLAKIGAEPLYYRTDPANQLAARSRSPARADHRQDARARGHRSEQPDRRDLSGRRAPRADRDRRTARPGDPRRRGLRRPRLRRPGAAAGGARSRRADHLLFEPVEGVSRAGLARRLDGGRRDAAPRRRAGGDQEAGGRPAVQPGPDAVRGRPRR